MRASHILWFGRLSMFLIFFWFGALKVFGISPAEELVMHLYDKTLIDLLATPHFSTFFGLFECSCIFFYTTKLIIYGCSCIVVID